MVCATITINAKPRQGRKSDGDATGLSLELSPTPVTKVCYHAEYQGCNRWVPIKNTNKQCTIRALCDSQRQRALLVTHFYVLRNSKGLG